MKIRVLLTVLVLGLALSGCTSNNNNEWQPVVCSVQSINGGAAVTSAAINTGSDPSNTNDDFVPLDVTTVLFWARAGNVSSVIAEDRAYSSFIITGYSATWTPGLGAPAELTTYNIERAPLSVRVPIDDEYAVAFPFASAAIKFEPWYPAQYSAEAFSANLDLVFYGHAEGSEHEVAIPAGTTVTFLGAVSNLN